MPVAWPAHPLSRLCNTSPPLRQSYARSVTSRVASCTTGPNPAVNPIGLLRDKVEAGAALGVCIVRADELQQWLRCDCARNMTNTRAARTELPRPRNRPGRTSRGCCLSVRGRSGRIAGSPTRSTRHIHSPAFVPTVTRKTPCIAANTSEAHSLLILSPLGRQS